MGKLFVKVYYAFLSIALILSSFFLTYYALKNLWNLFFNLTDTIDMTMTFRAVIMITLAMAIFDLAKTIFEEELILEKDPFKYSEVRRTLTRFLVAVIIAASMEILMLIFKFSFTVPQNLLYAALLLLGLSLLIVSLAVYGYLGVKTEQKKDAMK